MKLLHSSAAEQRSQEAQAGRLKPPAAHTLDCHPLPAAPAVADTSAQSSAAGESRQGSPGSKPSVDVVDVMNHLWGGL